MKSAGLFFVSFLLFITSASFAGECTEPRELYLGKLAATDIDKDCSEDISCLSSRANYFVLGYEYFASPAAIGKIDKENEASRKMVWAVLPKFLKSRLEINRRAAAETLAYYRWPGAYEYLAGCAISQPERRAVLYAILGDKRAVPWIIEQYRKIDSAYRKNPGQSYPMKMTFLNALYHLASPESLSFVEEIIGSPRPEKIKPRAIKVKQKIEEKLGKTEAIKNKD
ncbi:MAG: hypothetical protein WC522_05520 [Candidatus Omnitrophota bacterium]